MLNGKTVVVTGVGGGLGRECAASALREGADVVLAARTADSLANTAGELDPGGEHVTTHVTDITDADSCQALVDHAIDRFGSVDALIQVAAYENVWGGLLRPAIRGMAQGVRDQRDRGADRAPPGVPRR